MAFTYVPQGKFGFVAVPRYVLTPKAGHFMERTKTSEYIEKVLESNVSLPVPEIPFDQLSSAVSFHLGLDMQEEPIGKGGSGTVYVGVQLTDDRRQVAQKFALKVDTPRQANPESYQLWAKKSEQEPYLLSQCDHAHIVKYYSHFYLYEPFTNQKLAAVIQTELLDCNLHKILSRRTLGNLEIIQLAAHIISALHYLHSKGLAFHDVKPHNVLLIDESGGKLTFESYLDTVTFKLCDFGLVRSYDVKEAKECVPYGTAFFFSPAKKYASKTSPYNPLREDVCTFGVTLVAGKLGYGFVRDNSSNLHHAWLDYCIQNPPPTPQFELLYETIASMLAPEDRRYQIPRQFF